MINLEAYFEKGATYEAYKERMENQIARNADLSEYTTINQKRMDRVEKTFQFTDDQMEELLNMPNNYRVIIITEGWCGDAAQTVPIFEKMMQAMNVLARYVYRDENIELMNQYLTDGAQSIPILIAFDETNNEIFRYGPRPAQAMEMLVKHKADPEAYPKDQFYIDLQKFYNEDKGQSTYNELINLINESV